MKLSLSTYKRLRILLPIAAVMTALLLPSSAHAAFKWGGGLYPVAVQSGGRTVAWDILCHEPLSETYNTQNSIWTPYGIMYQRRWRTMHTKRLNTPDKSWADAYMYNFYLSDIAQFRPVGTKCDGSTFINYFWSVN